MKGMKRRTIKEILRRKIDAWIKSLDDPELRELCKRDVIVTGGCIASMMLGEKVNDYDIYFRTKETTLAVARYYVKKFIDGGSKVKHGFRSCEGREANITVFEEPDRVGIKVQSAGVAGEGVTEGYEYFESLPDGEAENYLDEALKRDEEDESKDKPKYRPIFLSTNAITLSDKVQIVLRFFGEPDEIHANYDFVHCTCYWRSEDNHLELRPEALEAMMARVLVYRGSRYPICSAIRTRKFIERGWQINAGQYLKMAFQITDLDLTDIKVLEDQLTGVDTAYFMEMIDLIQAWMKDHNEDKVDRSYVVQLIDRMF